MNELHKNLLTIGLLSVMLSSCSTDLDINADWKEIPVLYGMFNKDEQVHYVRVSKAFLPENSSALDIAGGNPDSIYYNTDDISVKLIRLADGQEFTMEFADLATEGQPREEGGDFFQSPNLVYRYTGSLTPDSEYEVKVENLVSGTVSTASAGLVSDFDIVFPPAGIDYAIPFYSGATTGGRPAPTNVQWTSAPNGRIYELTVRFHYAEWPVSGSILDEDTFFIDWPVFKYQISKNATGGETMYYDMYGDEFYRQVQNKIPINGSVKRRALDTPLDFIIAAGGEDFYNYVRTNQAQSGITQLQSQVVYSNVEGGLGLFSSRTFSIREHIKMSDISLDSLTCGQYTAALNFIGPVCN